MGRDRVKELSDAWTPAIARYCEKNQLSFAKLMSSARGCGQFDGFWFLYFQHFDPGEGGGGLLDETPCKLLLLVRDSIFGPQIEQTEYTKIYLAL